MRYLFWLAISALPGCQWLHSTPQVAVDDAGVHRLLAGNQIVFTQPVAVDTNAGTPSGVGAIRSPYIASGTPILGMRNQAGTGDLNVIGTEATQDKLLFGDSNAVQVDIQAAYVNTSFNNAFKATSTAFASEVIQVGENGGGAFMIVAQDGANFGFETSRTNGLMLTLAGEFDVYNWAGGSTALQETFSAGGIIPANVQITGVTGGTLTITAAQYMLPLIRLSGTLTSALTVVFPNQAGKWEVSISQLAGIGVTNTVTFKSGTATTTALTSLLSTSQVPTIYTYGSNTIDINQ
jgi:hypothetical protein